MPWEPATYIGEHAGNARIKITPANGPMPHLIKLGKDATDFVALASKVDAIVAALKIAVNGTT